jgi:DNA-binding transcriptional ArsR family regulator
MTDSSVSGDAARSPAVRGARAWQSDPKLRAQTEMILSMSVDQRLRQLEAEANFFLSATPVAHPEEPSSIRTLDDIIESMSTSAPALAPLFRSEQQLRLLSVLFTQADGELPIGELAERAGVAQATASREVHRLAEHDLVVIRALGRNTLVTANWSIPWARDLRSILMQTVGVLGRLADALGNVHGIDEAFVFGSWAARYLGEVGPPPRDIDVMIVGEAALRTVRRACAEVESELRIEVSPVIVDRNRWSAKKPDAFIAQVRDRPLVSIPLKHAS